MKINLSPKEALAAAIALLTLAGGLFTKDLYPTHLQFLFVASILYLLHAPARKRILTSITTSTWSRPAIAGTGTLLFLTSFLSPQYSTWLLTGALAAYILWLFSRAAAAHSPPTEQPGPDQKPLSQTQSGPDERSHDTGIPGSGR